MGRYIVLVILLIASLLASSAAADIWFVKSDGSGAAPNIQAAVDSASTGDTVLLAKGTYTGDGNRDVVITGKTITVISISGDPETCIIDCGGSETENHRAFGVYGNSTIEGIKITNGYMYDGGALYLSRGTITNCVFESNYAEWSGGAIEGGAGLIENCLFLENSTDNCGGAIVVFNDGGSGLVIANCLFEGNHATWNASAICPWNRFTCVYVDYCTFVDNWTTIPYAATIAPDNWYPTYAYEVVISNCTLVNNQGGIEELAEEGENAVRNTIITGTAKGAPIIGVMGLSCCDFYGNLEGDWVGWLAGQLGVNGNICEDPEFCDSASGDYTLLDTSPCAPDNSPEGCGLIGAHPVGCANADVEPGRAENTTWGAIKSLYR